MRDAAWMFLLLLAGMATTLCAVAYGGLWCGAVTAGCSGWGMAQRDEHYKRVRGL